MSDENDTEAPDNVVRVAFGGPKRPPKSPDDNEKFKAFCELIDRGMTMVTLDSRREGVRVPPSLQGQHQVLLNFSHRFGLDDFRYDEHAVSASLSFSGQPYFCEIPWSAVWHLRSHVDDTALVFPQSMPPEMAQVAKELQAAIERASAQEPSDAEVDPVPEAPAPPQKPAPRSNKPGLRLVED